MASEVKVWTPPTYQASIWNPATLTSEEPSPVPDLSPSPVTEFEPEEN